MCTWALMIYSLMVPTMRWHTPACQLMSPTQQCAARHNAQMKRHPVFGMAVIRLHVLTDAYHATVALAIKNTAYHIHVLHLHASIALTAHLVWAH